MRTVFDMAATAYAIPGKKRPRTGLARYSKYGEALLRFFHLHRTALAGHVHRAFPRFFKTVRDARRHLDTLVMAGHLDRVAFADPYQPNVYFIKEAGLRRCLDLEGINPRSIPERHEPPTGTQVLHELLVTETAVSVYEHVRLRTDVTLTWEERFGFHTDPAFGHLTPDWSFLMRGNDGLIWCAVEVIAGEESGTRIRECLRDYALWYETEEAVEFLRRMYAGGIELQQVPIRILCITQNRNVTRTDAAKERLTLTQTFFVPQEIQQFVWTTTNSALKSALDTGSINEPIWHRGKDLVEHRSRWHSCASRQHTRFMDELVAHLPTYTLFP